MGVIQFLAQHYLLAFLLLAVIGMGFGKAVFSFEEKKFSINIIITAILVVIVGGASLYEVEQSRGLTDAELLELKDTESLCGLDFLLSRGSRPSKKDLKLSRKACYDMLWKKTLNTRERQE